MKGQTKPPIPLSTFTPAEYRHPSDPKGPAHRLKRDPSRYLCRVSLCGLVVPEGWPPARWEWREKRFACPDCERAAKEAGG